MPARASVASGGNLAAASLRKPSPLDLAQGTLSLHLVMTKPNPLAVTIAYDVRLQP